MKDRYYKKILQKYIDISLGSDKKISFFILNGSDSTEISSTVLEMARESLGQYFRNDFLHIKDFSTQLKKQHNIKIQQKHDETYKILFSEYSYKDIGTREINSRFQQSSTGDKKILLIENIERMGIGAINAFLKTCEEPLPDRIIIATTSNRSQILDTVVSRAIVINAYQDIDLQLLEDNQDLSSIVKVIATDTNIHNKHKILSEINKKGMIGQILDELIAYYISQNSFHNAEKRLKIKKMSISNVNMDNLLFYGLLT